MCASFLFLFLLNLHCKVDYKVNTFMSNQTENHKKSKANLSKELIIQTALRMIEENGLEGFSLRKLAHKLNCEAMSIYYHMKNKEQILDQIVDFLV